MNSIYDFVVKDNTLNDIKLDVYKDKVFLIVNVASKCGFTPQYEGLEELYKKHNKNGFEILGFPCNQFGAQEPGSNEEIASFCKLNYGVTFKLFDKIDVNGENESPLYTYLKSKKPGLLGKNIKWNFTKFLVDKNGKIVKRFAPNIKPKNIEDDIIRLLRK